MLTIFLKTKIRIKNSIEKYIKRENSFNLKIYYISSNCGLLHPVVSGKEIGKERNDLIAIYANACDSTKSPFIL